MNRDNLYIVLIKINFLERYKKVCQLHDNFKKRMVGNHKELYSKTLLKIGADFRYYSRDKLFKTTFETNNVLLELGLKLHDGLIEPYLFYIENGEWILYNRFDGIVDEIEPGFRENFNIPKYSSELELEQILIDVYKIYEDFKTEFMKIYV